jgi:hypothetical protein
MYIGFIYKESYKKKKQGQHINLDRNDNLKQLKMDLVSTRCFYGVLGVSNDV